MQISALIDPEIGAALIEAAGPRLGETLLSAAQRCGRVEEVFAYAQHARAGGPVVLASCSALADAESRAALYARRFHAFDPAARQRGRAPRGTGFISRVASAEIERADYRALCFDRPRFVDKLCFGWRRAEDWIVLSFYRREADGEDGGALAALANVALAALARHEALRAPSASPLHARLKARLGQAYPSLAARELDVCARTLAGATADDIAQALGLKRASVLTYRQRAYQKLGVSSANALLDRLIV